MSETIKRSSETAADLVSPFISRAVAQWGDVTLTGEHDPIGVYSYGSEAFRSTLSSFDRSRSVEVVNEMVSRLGVLEADLRFVPEVISKYRTNIVLIDGSPNGSYVGNYSTIQDRKKEDNEWLTVAVGGETIDTLKATTYGVYWSMISEARKRKILLPDSVALSHTTDGTPWTATMLTGEELTNEGYIYVASVSSNAVSTVDHRPTKGGKSIRIRASVVLGAMVQSPTESQS